MAGLRKAKKYDWKDSNLALFGSDTEKEVKKASAETEKAWKASVFPGTGSVIWRINQFKVEEVPANEFGTFYEGDSYIIFHQVEDPVTRETSMDIYFWIGKHSTQDEYGTAAYKTVELDTFHDDKPVQHREVQDHESDAFKALFSKRIYKKGGYESGFRHVETVEYKIRLYRIQKQERSGRKKMAVDEISCFKDRMTEDDCFVLDKGDTVIQINGSTCSGDEKFKARDFIGTLQDERSGKRMKIITVDSVEEARVPERPQGEVDTDDDDEDETDGGSDDNLPVMYRLSDASGKMVQEEVQKGRLSRDMLDPQKNSKCNKDVFICDFVTHCFVWVGSRASPAEKKNGFGYAHKHLQQTNHPLASITVVKAGSEPKAFLDRFH